MPPCPLGAAEPVGTGLGLLLIPPMLVMDGDGDVADMLIPLMLPRTGR